MYESGTPVHSPMYVHPSSQPIMVICVVVGKLRISASESVAGRVTMPSTVNCQSTKLAAWSRLNCSPNGSTGLGERIGRNLVAGKLTRHGMARQQSLRCVGQRFSRAVKYSRIGRDEPMMLRNF